MNRTHIKRNDKTKIHYVHVSNKCTHIVTWRCVDSLTKTVFPYQLVSGSSIGQRVTRSRLTQMGTSLGLYIGLTVTAMAGASSTWYGPKCGRASFLIFLAALLHVYTITLSLGWMGLTRVLLARSFFCALWALLTHVPAVFHASVKLIISSVL